MASKSETGHAINVAHFNDLISFVTGYGTTYNPSNAALSLPALQTLATSAGNSIAAINVAVAPYNTAVAAREVMYAPLSKLVTRVMSFLKASGVSQQVYDSVNTVARKIKGGRASAKVAPAVPTGDETTAGEVKQVSASQMSYDSREENFAKFIQLLIAIPEYAPNEVELQTATLTELSTGLKEKNDAVINAEVPLSNARIQRNEVLYTSTTGLCDIALTVKNYIKAIFGATSPQYRQISKLTFKKVS
ncbi:hypothetical protein OU798_07840 [Prolixibacteraceae bacterium Z1-6]|uniref:Uncharacterized protein n=1 Tax=Draconibacterium aestuarii TaxID=2998507 RepID=A0A9X3F4J7_9BACT|nr:hypothetical protein [Prolixibacteraceae bacterium Z1-6]